MRQNRTLADMRFNVQTWMMDLVSNSFTDADIDQKLESALESLCNLLVNDNRGQRCLRKVSSNVAITANQQDYAYPGDCMRIEKMQYWDGISSPAYWHDLEFGRQEAATFLSGTCVTLSAPQASSISMYWSDTADASGSVRLSPTPSQTSGSIRFIYCFMPDFPETVPTSFTAWVKGNSPGTAYTANAIVANDGNYYRCITGHNAADANEPGTGASWETCWERIFLRLEGVPAGFDTAIEYYACALLAHEELEDGKPVGAFGNLFGQKYRELIGGPAGGAVRPQRRYVNFR